MSQKSLDLRRAHFPRVTFVVEKNEPTNPIGVALLGSDAETTRPDRIPEPVKKILGFLFLSMPVAGW